MRRTHRLFQFIFLLLWCVLGLRESEAGLNPLVLTEAERQWSATHHELIIGMPMISSPPYSYKDAVQGFNGPVPESTFVQDLGKSLEVLTRLRMHGFGLSIDDFGTSYSSMQQLALLPFTELKLDRSFVDRCHADPAHLAIIESSIELARKLGLKTVAEGVEDEATWHLLARLGCDLC